jgi:arsenate reductase
MDKKRVLFLCTHNSVRSQMAEGILRHMASDRFDVFSAGAHPSGVNPLAIKILKEEGIDISKQTSNSIDQFKEQNFDYVITVCDRAKQTCPVFPGKYKKIHWSLEDPGLVQGTEEEKLRAFRETREKLRERIQGFLKEIG